MIRFELYVDGQVVDFQDFEGLPFSLQKKVDRFLDVIGSDGVQIDSIGGELALPYTGKNAQIFGLPADPTSAAVPKFALESFALKNGTPVFSGSVYYERTQYTEAGYVIVISLAGDEIDPYSKLASVNLRDLPLGSSLWDYATVSAGYAASPLPSAIWAPVAYGSITQNAVWELENIRPHIQEKAILEAIMGQLGYRIDSTFHETEFFSRQYYLFGVGTRWEADGAASPYRGTAVLNGSNTFTDYNPFTGSQDPVNFTTFPTNPSGQMVSNGFQCQQAGYYDIEGTVRSNSPGLLISFFQSGAQIASFAVGGGGGALSAPADISFSFPRTYVEVGTEIRIYASADPGTYTAYSGTSLTANLINEPQPGNPIKLASCLHDRTAKDWLLGLMHKYCLVGKFDNVLRTFQYEPRFDYTIFQDGDPTSYPGWYKVKEIARNWDGPTKPFVNRTGLSLTHFSGLGNSLSLSFAIPEDGAGKAAFDSSRNSLFPDEYHCEFFDRGQEDEEYPNPYYSYLPLAKSLNWGSYPLIGYFPEQYELGDGIPSPRYEGKPASAMYFGQSSEETMSLDGNTIGLPLMYQKPGVDEIDGWTIASFSDTSNSVNNSQGTNFGLGTTFWLRYLLIIRQGDLLECQIALHDIDFEKEEFRSLVSFKGENFILLDLSGYTPTKDSLVSATLIKDISPTNDLFGTYIRQNYDVDTLLVN